MLSISFFQLYYACPYFHCSGDNSQFRRLQRIDLHLSWCVAQWPSVQCGPVHGFRCHYESSAAMVFVAALAARFANSTRLRTRGRVVGPPVNCCMIHLLPHSILLLFLIHHILSYIEVVSSTKVTYPYQVVPPWLGHTVHGDSTFTNDATHAYSLPAAKLEVQPVWTIATLSMSPTSRVL